MLTKSNSDKLCNCLDVGMVEWDEAMLIIGEGYVGEAENACVSPFRYLGILTAAHCKEESSNQQVGLGG